MVEETLREIQQNSQSNVVHLEKIFSGFPGRPAFNIPREVLEMLIENTFNVSESMVKRRLRTNGISFVSKHPFRQLWIEN